MDSRAPILPFPINRRIIPLLDTVDEDAVAIGAVNTIVNHVAKLTGYNTDVAGIEQALEPFKERIRNVLRRYPRRGRRGEGCSIRNLKEFFTCIGTDSIIGQPARLERLPTISERFFRASTMKMSPILQRLPAVIADSVLVVNTTPAGMTPNIDALPVPSAIRFSNHQIIFDIIYTPIETAFLRRAKADGATTINGVEMFVHQGAKAFELWTGKPFPVDCGTASGIESFDGRVNRSIKGHNSSSNHIHMEHFDMLSEQTQIKYERLRSIVAELGSVVIGYSGGVDSTLLLKVATDVLGTKAIAVIGKSATYPTAEYEEAAALAKGFGARYYRSRNRRNRCVKISGESSGPVLLLQNGIVRQAHRDREARKYSMDCRRNDHR